MATTSHTTIAELDSPADVLVFARRRKADADRAEADVLVAGVTWAEQHPPESIHEAAFWIGGGETGLTLAGQGAPLVAEFCIAEFAAALGRTTDSGKLLIAHGVELKYRLPKTWDRVMSGHLQTWRARRIAEATLLLSPEAAAYVDTQVAPFTHKIGLAQLDRLVQEAIDRFMPDLAQEKAEKAADGRHVKFHHDQVSFNGTTRIEGELDLADALDFDAALSAEAEQLAAAGSTESLDVRRAMAVGEITRQQLALDLSAHGVSTGSTGDGDGVSTSSTSVNIRKPRQVVLYVHLADAALRGEPGYHLARVENTRTGVTADQVRTWCANPDTEVLVKPVIDLNEHLHTGAYQVPKRLEEQTNLRDDTCIFPWCNRPAKRCDSEHCVPYDEGGTTCSCNIGPLCRRHHRVKTHSTWRYTTLEPGSFLWTSPHGYQLLRDHQGTVDVTSRRPPPKPDHPRHFY
ncbi:MAG: endonuclease [Marmoricola sp.]|jgi:hypothetical protein|nr:endonuclease [Marmoricola sp.]